MLESYRRTREEEEAEWLAKRAALSKEHSRFLKREDDHRMPYKRDVDRIIHSKAYSRYVDKTQVVYLVQNDHISHRSIHVQLVSNFARGIAEILRLNVDLVEAIALGHDVGHPPFGHEGEGYLSLLSQEAGEGAFAHSAQSCRLFSLIEPLNLGLAVYDGFLSHDGGLIERVVQPHFGKTWEDHFREYKSKESDPEKNIAPTTLEGALVKLCDTMSYLGRDIEDAISLKMISRDSLPKTCLGSSNREVLGFLAQDIIRESYDKEAISISDEAFQALKIIRKFNFENIYFHPKLKVESEKIKTSYRLLFETLLGEYKRSGKKSFLWTQFLENKSKRYLEETTDAHYVIDYIAGMTDTYFVKTVEKLIIPKRIEIHAPTD